MSGTRRDRPLPHLALGLALVASLAVPAAALGREPRGIDRFMWAIGWYESGGRYDVRNAHSGAFGKYQIMPASWSDWSAAYLGQPDAAMTASNQETVARAKFTVLYRWLGSWSSVAFWWLTGTVPDPHQRIHASTHRYVDGVMSLYRRGPARTMPARERAIVEESAPGVLYAGRWASAGHPGYLGGHVRYSRVPWASATTTFVGRSVAWVGPVGPTRGRARVLLDGVTAAIVDLRAPAFRPRRTVFARRWGSVAAHTITIEVLPEPGRPIVAIDALVVRQ